MSDANNLPSALTMVRNAATAAVQEAQALAAGTAAVADAEVERRLALCDKCDLFIPQQNRCSRCGCFMKFKAKLRSQHCPIGKW